jgi:hypothetical protein
MDGLMQSKVPLPTDNIFKFYALSGLVLFIFCMTSMLFVSNKTNELVYSTIIDVETLNMIEKPTKLELAKKTILERRLEVALENKELYLFVIGVLAGVAVISMYYGFRHWHTIIQPLQDELLLLNIQKLKKELRHKPVKRK